MDIKKVLKLLANQYSKSFKRFEKAYSFMSKSDFDAKVKEFNSSCLNVISAVLSGDTGQIRRNLLGSSLYV